MVSTSSSSQEKAKVEENIDKRIQKEEEEMQSLQERTGTSESS